MNSLKFNVVQYKEYLGDDKRKRQSLICGYSQIQLATNVSLEEAICIYQGKKHREGLRHDDWFVTIKVELVTEDLNS